MLSDWNFPIFHVLHTPEHGPFSNSNFVLTNTVWHDFLHFPLEHSPIPKLVSNYGKSLKKKIGIILWWTNDRMGSISVANIWLHCLFRFNFAYFRMRVVSSIQFYGVRAHNSGCNRFILMCPICYPYYIWDKFLLLWCNPNVWKEFPNNLNDGPIFEWKRKKSAPFVRNIEKSFKIRVNNFYVDVIAISTIQIMFTSCPSVSNGAPCIPHHIQFELLCSCCSSSSSSFFPFNLCRGWVRLMGPLRNI